MSPRLLLCITQEAVMSPQMPFGVAWTDRVAGHASILDHRCRNAGPLFLRPDTFQQPGIRDRFRRSRRAGRCRGRPSDHAGAAHLHHLARALYPLRTVLRRDPGSRLHRDRILLWPRRRCGQSAHGRGGDPADRRRSASAPRVVRPVRAHGALVLCSRLEGRRCVDAAQAAQGRLHPRRRENPRRKPLRRAVRAHRGDARRGASDPRLPRRDQGGRRAADRRPRAAAGPDGLPEKPRWSPP